jgi:hypothetical protein
MDSQLYIEENRLLFIIYFLIKIVLFNIYSKTNLIINEVNWNILLTSGKEIKRDSTINEN